jgi:hypothetical protein
MLKLGLVALREEHISRVVRRIFGPRQKQGNAENFIMRSSCV